MKIAYVCQFDAKHPAAAAIAEASVAGLKRNGATIEEVFPLEVKADRSISKKVLYRMGGKFYRSDREPQYLQAVADEFERRTTGRDYDVVFCLGSQLLTCLRTSKPVVFFSDATFASMVDYYWDFTNLPAEYTRKGHAQEAAALARASLAIYASEWAARSAVADYGTDASKVAVTPTGAIVGQDNTWDRVGEMIARRPHDQIRLLFISRHWDRRGGDIVVNAAYCLSKLGHRVSLDVVGCPVPQRHRSLPWLRGHGYLDSRVPDQRRKLDELFGQAHFAFVPSRAEANGLIFAEANAYGVPAISTATGGIPGVVETGRNGFLLPIDAGPEAYADLIASASANHDHYTRLCRQSFETFVRILNWDAFGRRIVGLLRERVLVKPGATARGGHGASPVNGAGHSGAHAGAGHGASATRSRVAVGAAG